MVRPSLKSKVSVVTGGSSGIGLAIAKALVQRGDVVFNLDVQANALEGATFIKCDVSRAEDLSAARLKIEKLHSEVDYLIVNAGIHERGSIEETTVESLTSLINTNVVGAFLTVKTFVEMMKKQGDSTASVVFIGSDQSLIAKPRNAAYGLTKAAVAHLSKSSAVDLARYGIRVNCVCPGTVQTPLVENALKGYGDAAAEKRELLANAQLIKRLGRPEEVASAVSFLCSTEASYITGSLLSVDGGYTTV